MTTPDRPGTDAAWICQTCGVQHERAARPPNGCHICLDERQYVLATGQSWTTQAELARAHQLVIDRSEEHTSELQSRLHLVCRLLLEKKKKTKKKIHKNIK